MKITLRNLIKTLYPYQNRIAQKQRELPNHMNIFHTGQNNSALSSKQVWNSSACSFINAESSKGLALYCWNQRISQIWGIEMNFGNVDNCMSKKRGGAIFWGVMVCSNSVQEVKSIEDVKVSVKIKLAGLWTAVIFCYSYADILAL